MKRTDSIGIFWQDVPVERGRNRIPRVMPPIPDTGWLPPTEYPNLSAAPGLIIDVETKDKELRKRGPGWARHKGQLVGVSVGTTDGTFNRYFPIRHEVEPEYNLDSDHTLAWLRDTLANPKQPKIGANIIYDVGWLQEEGVRVLGDLHDVQMAEALLSEGGKVALEVLAQKYLGEGKTTSLLYDWCSNYYGGPNTERQRENIYRTPPRLVGPYAEGDTALPNRIIWKQFPLLVQQGLYDVYRMECDLIRLLIDMRFAGVHVDLEAAEELYAKLGKEQDELQKQLNAMAGFGVNTNASDSLARAFDGFGIHYPRTKPTTKKPNGSPSFTKDFLKSVDHPLAQLVSEIRLHSKLKDTFVKGYILESHLNGYLYGEFHLLRSDEGGTRSGRFSSSHPNLQNIPKRAKLAKWIRRCFIPDDGHAEWWRSDYSQIEYRGLAHFAVGSGADNVRQRYVSDPMTDFHEMVRQLIKEFTGQLLDREPVKTINFGLVYGMGVASLSHRLGLTEKQGKAMFATYHKGAPFIKPTMEATMKEAEQLGYITTILGRRSRFDLWEPREWKHDEHVRALPYEWAIRKWPSIQRAYLHKALNRRLQGSAADLMKMAMLLLYKSGVFAETGVPRLTVHDELDFSNPDKEKTKEAFRYIVHVMETAIPFRIPIKTEVETGPNWGDVAKVA